MSSPTLAYENRVYPILNKTKAALERRWKASVEISLAFAIRQRDTLVMPVNKSIYKCCVCYAHRYAGNAFRLSGPVPAAHCLLCGVPMTTSPPFLPHRVLVIDDNADAADMLSVILTCLGHEARFATSGPAGIELARAFRPDIVFVDIGMPLMNGFDVARRIRSITELNPVRLVALTAWSDAVTQMNAYAAGFDVHLSKPAPIESIGALLAFA